MKRIGIVLIGIIVVIAVMVVGRPLLAGREERPLQASLESLPVVESGEGFARATVPGAIEFPRDLGPHNDYQTEWWYYTGNLATADGRPFGFQFTIFRRALLPEEMIEAGSDWRTSQLYLAHFTVSDIAAGQFYPAERFSRGAAGLAGARAQPYRVWLEDWTVEEIAPGQVRLQARSAEAALDLILTETLPPVLHGDRGLSPKGPEPGNASYYYSIVQQQATGTVTTGGQTFDVRGQAWKDHEWSTSALSAGAVGWDWVSLQLDNGGALMLFEIRRDDGSLEATSAGSYITPDGEVQHLALGDWTLEVTDTWTSPTSGAEYPAGWRITVPSIDLELTGRPKMASQELNVSTVYWEGAVDFEGTLDGEPIEAQGYIELTGYAGSMEGRL
jgi:predicted secreted hydrolase